MSALVWYFLFAIIGTPAALYVASNHTPDEFTLNGSSLVPDIVWNVSYPRSVEKTGDDSFTMDTSACVVISSSSCSQYFFECTPVINGSPDFSVRMRTTASDVKAGVQHGIECVFRNDSMLVYENAKRIGAVDSVYWMKPERLLFIHYAGDVLVIKGCRTIFHGSTQLPAADGIVITTSSSSAMKLTNVVRNFAEKWWDKRVDYDSPVVDRQDNSRQAPNPLLRFIR